MQSHPSADHDLYRSIQPLAAGPLDIIGDIHGEIEALGQLLRLLGYRDDGSHPHNRRLVFVGDLCDRGPDSPGVLAMVAALVQTGRAQCILGNHELNLLRNTPKAGNGWFFADDHDRRAGKFQRTRQAADDRQRAELVAFIGMLPLALQRQDLRIVHAAWHPESLRRLHGELATATVPGIYAGHEAASNARARQSGIIRQAADEFRSWGPHLEDEDVAVPLLPGIGAMDEAFQMANPIRVVTSGVERLAKDSFYASGKWRMVSRVAWWQDYTDPVPVIFGHYWRWADPDAGAKYSRGEKDLFAGQGPHAWLGPRRNAFCVDFSVGVRYRERPLAAGRRFLGRLGAVRWPEQELVFDDGERQLLTT